MALAHTQQTRKGHGVWAVLAGLLVLGAGFGVIITFWYTGSWRSDIPGFWTYRSPNIGDGILLPIAAGLLIGAGNKLIYARYEAIATLAGVVFGVAGGAALQLVWLSDPNPLLNWTVPAPHTFNTPGIYHAIFLAAASGFFTGAIVRLLWRAHFNRRTDPVQVERLIQSPAAALLIACIVGFACLVALDGHHVHGFTIKNTPTSLSATIIALIAVVIAALLVAWGFGRSAIRAWRTFAWGLFLAASIGLVAWDTYDTAQLFRLPQILVISMVGITIALFLWKAHGRFWWIQAIAACLILIGGLSRSFVLATSSLNLALLVALAVVVGIGFIMGMVKLKQARRYMLGIIFPVLLLDFFVWMSLGSHAAANAHLIAPLLSLLWPIAMLVGVQIYPDLIEDEKKYGSGYLAEQSYWVTYLSLVLLFVAAVISSLELANLPGSVLRVGSAENAYPSYYGVEILGLGVAIVIALLAAWRSHAPKPRQELPIWPEEPVLRPRLVTVFWMTVIVLLWGASPWVATVFLGISPAGVEPSDFRAVIYVAAAVYAIWLGLITADSFRANLSILEFYRFSAGAWVVTTAASLAVASAVAWLWLVGLWTRGDWASYLSIAKIVLIIVVGWLTVVPLCAWALERARLPMKAKPPYLGLHRPATHIFNDAIMHGFSLGATIFAILAVSQVIRTVMAATDSAAVLVQVLLTILPFIVVLVPAFIYVISTTGGHVKQESERKSASMIERAGNDEKLAIKLHEDMIHRMKTRFDYVENVAFPLSPYGFFALVVNIFKRFIG